VFRLAAHQRKQISLLFVRSLFVSCLFAPGGTISARGLRGGGTPKSLAARLAMGLRKFCGKSMGMDMAGCANVSVKFTKRVVMPPLEAERTSQLHSAMKRSLEGDFRDEC